MKRIALGLFGLVVLVILAAGTGLTWAHLAIRRERAPLPTLDAVVATRNIDDGPVRLSVINTASQPMPRSAVLDASDPQPQAPYVMSHPSFVLEWADGRILLVDAGMDPEQALSFGKPIERFSGGSPIEPHAAAADRLGDARRRVQGIVFTHLHTDHVGGITALCRGLDHPLRVFQTEAQAERPNYTTRSGLALIRDSGCARPERLSGNGILPVPGFPGVAVIAAGGHTPGSQIILATVGPPSERRLYVFAGDLANNIDGVSHNIPKPYLYSLLLVPEDRERLAELRPYLRDLRDRGGATILLAHDQLAIEASGVRAWE